MKLNRNSLKLNLGLVMLPLLAIVAAACAQPQQAADLPEAATSPTFPATDVPLPPSATDTAASPANPVIAPEALGQLRLLWNVNFPGDLARDPSCYPPEQECTLSTNIAGYAFSPDGNTLAVSVCLGTRTQDKSQPNQDEWGCTAESAIILYDAATGAERIRFAPAALPLSLAFHPDGMLLAAGLANSDIELWALPSGERVGTLLGNPKVVGVRSLAFTPDGYLLISGSGEAFQLQVRDWLSGSLLTTIDRVIGIGISPDSGSLVTLHLVNEPDAIRVYKLTQTDSFTEIPLAGQFAPTEFSFNPLNGWISSVELGSNSYLANFWDPASSSIVATLEFTQDYAQTGVQYDLNSGGFTPGGYFLLGRAGQLTAPEAQPDTTGLSETLWACGFALADMQANQIFFSPPMLYDVCTGPDYMYDVVLTYQVKILSPDGSFIAADDGFGNLRVWGIDASAPAVPPECSGDC